MATPSLLGLTSVTGQLLCVTQLSGTAATTVYTVPASTGVKIAGGALCNTTGSAVTVSVSVVPSGGTAGATNQIVSGYSLAANDSLSLKDLLGGIFLGEADAVSVTASTGSAVVVWLSGVVSGGATSTAVGSSLLPTAIKTADYTAANGDLVRVSTASGARVVTLPAATAGAVLAVKLVAQASTNAVTVNPAGSDTIDSGASLTISTLQDVRTLLGFSGGWIVANGLATASGGGGAVSSVNGSTGAVTGLAVDSAVAHNSGAETWAGIKTFSSLPVIPTTTPTTTGQVASKGYVDTVAAGITAGGVSDASTSVKGIVQLAGDLAGTAASPTVPGKVPHLVPTALKTSAYTAAANEFVLVDTTSAGVTITFPTAPADKTRVGVKLVVQPGTNTVSFALGGSDVFNIAGGATTAANALKTLNQAVTFQYQASGAIWVATGSDLSLTQLDLRYAAIGGGGSSFYSGVFGDGTDGSATLDGTATVAWASKSGSTYTMTRDCHTTALTISSGATLIPGPWRIFCQGTVTNAGTISADGNAGNANGTAGAASALGGPIYGGSPGGAGNTGAGTAGGQLGSRIGMSAGGAGGAGASGAAGGTGFSTAPTGVATLKPPQIIMTGAISWNGGASSFLGGGPGGGGGGGDGTNKGGGGGGGAGIIPILAAAFTNTGTLTAKGGAGGTPTTGNCGGGGGGAGGLILIYTRSAATGLPTAASACTGGAAGSGVGTGSAGVAGGVGSVMNAVLA
jgi:hypothetical protein